MSVTQVTLGNFFTLSNGKTVLGGAGGSGLDTQSLIKSLVAAQSVPVTEIQDQISLNDKQSSALNTMQTLFSKFQSAADALRNPPGVGNAADNVFKFTTGNVSAGGTNYLSITTAAGAANQSYQISDISSIASAATQGTGIFTIASADASVVPAGGGASTFGAGNISINGQTITLANGDSLNSVAAKFNAVSGTTGIGATVLAIDGSHFQLSFVATKTGTSGNFDLSTVTADPGVLTGVNLTGAVPGTNAAFKINNVPIVRQTNIINDVVNGVTFNILQKTPDTTPFTASVVPDTTSVQNAINNFVSSYNAVKTFQAQQTQLKSDGTYASTAILANNQTFLSAMSNINSQINSQVAGITGTNPQSLVDVGITFTNQPATSTTPEVDGVLTVNDGQLTSALSSNFNGVSQMFGFNLTSDNPNLAIFSETNSLNVSNFTLNINPGTSTFTATYNPGTGPVTVNLTATALTGSSGGYTLTGPSGSALDGMVMIYASTNTATIHATATQGIADKLFNSANSATLQNTGTLALELQRLQKSDTTLNNNITQLNAQISVYQQTLLNKFTALERAISQTNTLLQSLNANQNAQLVSAGH